MTYDEIVTEIEQIGEWLRDPANVFNVEERVARFERGVLLTRMAKAHLVEAHHRIKNASNPSEGR